MSHWRCSASLAEARRRMAGHSGAKAGAGRSQLRTLAAQASPMRSASKPGSSDQATGTQRLLACVKTPAGGASVWAAAGVGAASPATGMGRAGR